MGGCQSRDAATTAAEGPTSPRFAEAILRRMTTPEKSSIVIPDVEDDYLQECSFSSSSLFLPRSPLSSSPLAQGTNHHSDLKASSFSSKSPESVASSELFGTDIVAPEYGESEALPPAWKNAFSASKTQPFADSTNTEPSTETTTTTTTKQRSGQQRLRSSGRRHMLNLSFGKNRTTEVETTVLPLPSLVLCSPSVAATEIPEEVDPDAPSDEEDFHEQQQKTKDDEEPGRLIMAQIRTKHSTHPHFSTQLVAPVETPDWIQNIAADTEEAAVHPDALNELHRLSQQHKIYQQQIQKQSHDSKLQERMADVQSYKQLWDDFQTIQQQHLHQGSNDSSAQSLTEFSVRPSPLISVRPMNSPEAADDTSVSSSSGRKKQKNSASKNITVRRSQRNLSRSNSFTLGESSSWFFDFQGTEFVKEPISTTQGGLSLLNEKSLEIQKRLFAEKRRSRKHAPHKTKTETQPVGGSGSSVSSIGADYGPTHRRRTSFCNLSAPALCDDDVETSNRSVEITNIEVSFSSPSGRRDKHGDDASCVSDLGDDVSASNQFRSLKSRSSRTKEYGAAKGSTGDALNRIEERLAALNRMRGIEQKETIAIAQTPQAESRLVTESPISAAMYVNTFQTAVSGSNVTVVRSVEAVQVSPFPPVDPRRRDNLPFVSAGNCLGNKPESSFFDSATPRIKNRSEGPSRQVSHSISPEQTEVDDCFNELGQARDTSLLETSIGESTIDLLDDSRSFTSKGASSQKSKPDDDDDDDIVVAATNPTRKGKPPPAVDSQTSTADQPRQSSSAAAGSIATMTKDEFFLISEEGNVEQQTRKELNAQILLSLPKIQHVSGTDTSAEESFDNAVMVTPEKATDKSEDEIVSADVLEQMVVERKQNRLSLAQLRGFEEDDDDLVQSSLLLAEKVEAQVQNVLCKYREGSVTN